MISTIDAARARYFASLEERALVGYFLVAHEINVFPKNVQYPMIDQRSMRSIAQSESEYVVSTKEAGKIGSPNAMVPSMYQRSFLRG